MYISSTRQNWEMNKKTLSILIGILCIGSVFVGCKDNTDDLSGQGFWSIKVTGENTDDRKNEAIIDMYGRYYSIYTTQTGERDAALLLQTEAEWLTLMTDTLPADGILQILAEENDETRERSAEIFVQSAGTPERQAVITIRQRSESSYGENATNPYDDFRVGRGFSAFDEYKSPRSVRNKIIDVSRLMLYDSDSTFHSTQEVLRGRENFTITNSWSLQEMSSKLTQDMVATTKFLGVKKTTHRFKEVATKDVREQACVYARLQKTVASRSIDGGALRYLVNLPTDELTHGLPFTEEFREAYNQIVNSSGEEQKMAIQNMLDNFGTHLITEAAVGCMMDMTLTFDKSESYDMESEVEQKCRSIFGRSTGSSSSSKTEHMTCTINNSNCIQIFGGSKETRNNLEKQVKNLTSAKQLSPELVEAWMSSVSTSMLKDHRENLEVVDFHFMPIWELFTDPTISGHIQQQVIEMSNRSDCSFTEAELSIDNYEIDLTNPDLTNFSTSSNASLVRLARINDKDNTPILEICQEYVPKICSDRRINVFYPVFAGRTRIGQGLFPGDGQGNPPAILTFSDGDVFVNPLVGYGYHDVIKKVYYIHGNLYTDTYEMGINTQQTLTVEDELLTINSNSYPIVKICTGFWTRKNMIGDMMFGNEFRGRFQVYETTQNGMLYAQILGKNSPIFLTNHNDIYGTEIDNATGKATKWYLPTLSDKKELTDYLGNNHKSLMKGQPSGFDAEFAGYYGNLDPRTGENLWETKLREVGQYSYIPFKTFITSTDGQALVLAPDYTWQSYSIKSSHNNYFPVRLFRTSLFKIQ